MFTRARTIGWLAMMFGAWFSARAHAQDPGPRFTLSGTSTVRAWSCPAQGVLKVTPAQSLPPVPGFPRGVQTVSITVPVKAIECEDETMREHLREALKEKAYPQIVYQLVQYTLTGSDSARTTGKITITGVTRPIDLVVTLVSSPQGLRTVGDTSIDMTQFNVAPPVLWEGLMKVGKMVRVKFEAVLPPVQ